MATRVKSIPIPHSDPADFVSWLGVADLATATDQVTLTADLDLKDLTVEPASSFAGIFDGNGKTIKNAVLPNALFANLAETAVVKNLKIANTCSINWTDAIPDETGVAFIASKSRRVSRSSPPSPTDRSSTAKSPVPSR